MNKEDLDALAARHPYCRSFGESVSLSRVERDELVAMARDGMRYRWIRDVPWYGAGTPLERVIAQQRNVHWDDAIDAVMAKEQT
ncbi:hypothetical protein D3C71_351670 [compost metagenome]